MRAVGCRWVIACDCFCEIDADDYDEDDDDFDDNDDHDDDDDDDDDGNDDHDDHNHDEVIFSPPTGISIVCDATESSPHRM